MEFSKAVLAVGLCAAAPLFADSVTGTSLQGLYNTYQGPVAACTGIGTCHASTTVSFSTPQTGPVQMPVSINGQAGFALSDGHQYGFNGQPVPAGSYYLSANLGVSQGFDYGAWQQDLNPQLNLSAVFNMPADSGDWTVQTFFYEYGDAVNPNAPADTAAIHYNGQQYVLSNACTYSPWGINCGSSTDTFMLGHTPGTLGQIAFDTSAFSNTWGTDTVEFEAILTDPLPSDASPTPEPASAYLLLGGALLLAGKGFRRTRKGK